MWEEKLKEELLKTKPLNKVCASLREEMDQLHNKRLESFGFKMRPIINKDGPSKKVNKALKNETCINCNVNFE